MEPVRFGKHSVVRKIASGGMSDVYLCRLRGEEGFEKKTAVKVIPPRLSASARFRELFIREARIAASLSHPNLVQVFDFGREGESYYLAMEFVEGWNLAQAVAQLRLRSLPIPLPVWRAWTEGVVEGLGYLHSRKIVHRDVSPSNVLVSRNGSVKIADFGIARRPLRGQEPAAAWEGKAAYLSPERARGEEAGFSSDLFAAAVIAAELFLPSRLFEGRSPEETAQRIRDHAADRIPAAMFPAEVSSVLCRALSPAAEDRYPDAAGLAGAVSRAVPAFPSRAEHARFWDLLFPAAGSEDDTVVREEGGPPEGVADRVRERGGPYGTGGRRRLGLGIASGVAAVSLGTALFWTASRNGIPGGGTTAPSPAGIAGRPGASEAASSTVESVAGRVAGTGSPAAEGSAGTAGGSAKAAVPVSTPRRAAPSGEDAQGSVLLATDPEGVAVALEDGTLLGRTPMRLDPAAWEGRVFLLRKEGYQDRRIPASGLSGVAGSRIGMERRTGVLEVVQAIPWARVYDGDRFLGVTPIVSLRLPVGRNRLRFVNEALGVEIVESVDVRPGGNPRLIVPLVTREGSGGP